MTKAINTSLQSNKIPAIIPIVLHTGTQKWKAPTAFKEIIKESERFNEHIVNFNSLLIDTSVIGDEAFLKQKSVIKKIPDHSHDIQPIQSTRTTDDHKMVE